MDRITSRMFYKVLREWRGQFRVGEDYAIRLTARAARLRVMQGETCTCPGFVVLRAIYGAKNPFHPLGEWHFADIVQRIPNGDAVIDASDGRSPSLVRQRILKALGLKERR